VSKPNIYVTEGRAGYWIASIPRSWAAMRQARRATKRSRTLRRAFRAYIELLDARGVSWSTGRASIPMRSRSPNPMVRCSPRISVPIEEHDLRDFLHVFEAQHAALIALASTLSADELERAPDADTWSVREALGAHDEYADVAALTS
jgi:hypothetical protein